MRINITTILILAVIGMIAVGLFIMKRQADDARNKSDEIMKQFKTIDNDLQQSRIKIDSMSQSIFDSIDRKTGK